MEKKMLNNDFILSIAEQEAWDKLSSELHWSETMLEKFKDNVNWEEISSNSEIFWTISMLKKFSYRIDWNELSRMICNESLSEECITTFADKYLADGKVATLLADGSYEVNDEPASPATE